MIHRARRWVMRFDLSDEDWTLLEPLLPKSRKSARVDDRKIMNAIFYVLRPECRCGICRHATAPTRRYIIAPIVGLYARSGSVFRPTGIEIARQSVSNR